MMNRTREPLIFERSVAGKIGMDLPKLDVPAAKDTRPAHLRRTSFDAMPSVTEVDVIRHFTRLSKWNYGVDDGLYPLGSCTMKHNPRLNEKTAGLDGFCDSHPMTAAPYVQGNLAVIHTLQEWLKEITGLAAVTLQPSAGAAGELTGAMLIRAFHVAHGRKRRVILIPDSAHGTNPATAAMAGYEVVEIASQGDGTVSFADVTDASGKVKKGLTTLLAELGEEVAGLMITNPNTLGIFEYRIKDICEALHAVGGLVYMDGANMNALVGVARPGDFGVDVMHLNLHKTFSTPHGGGGPGSGPVACSAALEPFLPRPVVVRETKAVGEGQVPVHTYRLDWDRPQSMGKVHTFFGNFGILVRALTYCASHGGDGLRAATLRAIVNANYIRKQLEGTYHLEYQTPTLHEVIFDDSFLAPHDIHTLDVAKGLIDRGFHPPTIYFPAIVHGALMIEPTESEGKEEMDAFIDAMKDIAREAAENPEALHQAPVLAPMRRLDETTAARKPVLRWTRPQ
ncbi:aminomethyl-transferring glycine dehydrogenase subunit GcvPB [Mesoterricola silvestris]|uniref:glycine dehydrogenase (aminomethyl-transferring) n=1 Tax=Mesoterricola silvestris TaxID=2927979 RepID=A0AA48GL13_9BACT|nr:aminomethyl-transferring glycine dehydrogenase subunit GcvPB [Mesoterricola silvestris]BDU75026.1 putative glycine dehydrogenase (decarboxylating) subunit 2 [Mesoterricola silvestris]